MESNEFIRQLIAAIDFPFEDKDVEEVEENCGTTYITLTNGDVYYLNIGKTERDWENDNNEQRIRDDEDRWGETNLKF